MASATALGPSALLRALLIVAASAVAPSAATSLAAQDSAGGLLVAGNLDDAARPHWSAVRAMALIHIDGRIDETVWATAPVIDRFVQQPPSRSRGCFPSEPGPAAVRLRHRQGAEFSLLARGARL